MHLVARERLHPGDLSYKGENLNCQIKLTPTRDAVTPGLRIQTFRSTIKFKNDEASSLILLLINYLYGISQVGNVSF